MASLFKALRVFGIAFGASVCCAQYGSGVWEAFANHPRTVEARERNERRRPVCSFRLPEAERLVEQNPRDGRAWETIGRCKLQSGLTGEAVAAFRRILRMNPDSADAFSLLGHPLLQKGDREDAREMFEAALRINPIEDQAYRGLGAYQAMKGATREAIESYETALKLASGRAEPL
jgi:tetratricopeptide (TPR) repeat protein